MPMNLYTILGAFRSPVCLSDVSIPCQSAGQARSLSGIGAERRNTCAHDRGGQATMSGHMNKHKKQLAPWLVGLIIAVIVFAIVLVVLNALGYGDDPAVGMSG